jgi:hypothetical protein
LCGRNSLESAGLNGGKLLKWFTRKNSTDALLLRVNNALHACAKQGSMIHTLDIRLLVMPVLLLKNTNLMAEKSFESQEILYLGVFAASRKLHNSMQPGLIAILAKACIDMPMAQNCAASWHACAHLALDQA